MKHIAAMRKEDEVFAFKVYLRRLLLILQFQVHCVNKNKH
jgi:hypothetical protein